MTKHTEGPLLSLAERLVETVKLCRDCKWDVLHWELVHLMTGLESEAKEAIEKAKEMSNVE
tara:strand:- start:749 stop:931 length:183 start_codon:yes stop_codon:yes gene_type:complete